MGRLTNPCCIPAIARLPLMLSDEREMPVTTRGISCCFCKVLVPRRLQQGRLRHRMDCPAALQTLPERLVEHRRGYDPPHPDMRDGAQGGETSDMCEGGTGARFGEGGVEQGGGGGGREGLRRESAA